MPWSKRSGVVALLLASVLWGSTFVVVKQELGAIAPSVMVAWRFSIAALFLAGLAWAGRDRRPGQRPAEPLRWRWVVQAGLDMGLWLAIGYVGQTISLQFTSAGRSAFSSSLYVVFLPLLMWGLGKPVASKVWGAIALAVAGVALLSQDGAPPNWGDLGAIGVAVSWTLYIWRIEAWVDRLPPLPLALSQTVVVAIVGWVWAGLAGEMAGALSRSSWLAMGYLGAIGTGLTIWLQAWGQRSVPSVLAALLYALEPVWAALLAGLVLGERLSLAGWMGAGLLLAAVILSQVGGRG